MEEEILEISDYLPINVSEERLSKLINHHLIGLQACIQHGLYSSSLLHLHVLYMIIIYLQIHRIANSNISAFNLSLIGFNNQEKEILKNIDFPLIFSKIKEKTVFRFFRLNNIDDQMIGELSKPVDRRNKHMHASDDLVCSNEKEFSDIFNEYIRNLDKILEKNINILEVAYNDPSIQQLNDEEYEITDDDVDLLIVANLFSRKELGLFTSSKSDKLSNYIKEYYGL